MKTQRSKKKKPIYSSYKCTVAESEVRMLEGKGLNLSQLWEPHVVSLWMRTGGSQNPGHIWTHLGLPASRTHLGLAESRLHLLIFEPTMTHPAWITQGCSAPLLKDYTTQEIDKCNSSLIINVNCTLQSWWFILHGLRKSITTFLRSRSESSRVSFITTQEQELLPHRPLLWLLIPFSSTDPFGIGSHQLENTMYTVETMELGWDIFASDPLNERHGPVLFIYTFHTVFNVQQTTF